MRKYHKKLVMEMLESLTSANKVARETLKKEDTDQIINILADEQGVIQQISSFLSSFPQVPKEVLTDLEEYNKLLFTASQDINGESLKKVGTALTQLKKKIKTQVVAERIEMVFLPYNASMSDSLESIWLAAHQDPNCDVYIMPIPYYDKDSQGNFAKEQYHLDYYKGDVPVVSYHNYDLEARHPDVIFIHNPYDDKNYVTSVASEFYSEKLKKYTEKLVYVPYFTAFGDVAEHFVAPPGVFHADLVFVDSESVKEDYQRGLKNIYQLDKKRTDGKIIASGSPKLDKVINSKPEDFTLPAEWESLITAADGTRKKVVLYNTSLTALLKHSDTYILKLKEVLRYFKERDDVVLWWRPHPLTDGTCQSMRPRLLEEYNRILAQYKVDCFGILDESHDLHRAIALSDMYYGDHSSVATLYAMQDKLIVMQLPEVVDMSGEVEDVYQFSEEWEKLLKSTHFESLFSGWIAAVSEKNRIWNGAQYGESINVGFSLSYYLDIIFKKADKNRLENLAALFNFKNQYFEKMGHHREGKNGLTIYHHVKGEVMK